MKKFSTVAGVKVATAPEIEKTNESEIDLIKAKIYKLMDDMLSIRAYGSVSPVWRVPTKISGKEMFVEALLDLISDNSIKDQVKILESLKNSNKDWMSIDVKIGNISNSINITSEDEKNSIEKIKSTLDKYSDNEEQLKLFLENQSNRVKSSGVALSRHLAANKMMSDPKFSNFSKDHLKLISDLYLNRHTKLTDL
jgi:hypothetical protein